MATGFIHMLPEIHNGIHEQGLDEKVPLGELVCCIGFFLIYFVEELVHIYSDRYTGRQNQTSDSVPAEGNGAIENSDASISPNDVKNADAKAGHGHSHSHPPMQASLEGFIIVLGLSLHSVFEGMAIGLESDPHDVWMLFAAVASHKLVIAFCIGLEMSVTGISLALHTCYMLTFCSATPLGIGIGMIFTDNDTEKQVSLVLQALAAGTMIYVAFFEVIARERSKSVNKLLQLVAIVFGYGVMLTLDTLLNDGD